MIYSLSCVRNLGHSGIGLGDYGNRHTLSDPGNHLYVTQWRSFLYTSTRSFSSINRTISLKFSIPVVAPTFWITCAEQAVANEMMGMIWYSDGLRRRRSSRIGKEKRSSFGRTPYFYAHGTDILKEGVAFLFILQA